VVEVYIANLERKIKHNNKQDEPETVDWEDLPF
jgi:hypothetical protein